MLLMLMLMLLLLSLKLEASADTRMMVRSTTNTSTTALLRGFVVETSFVDNCAHEWKIFTYHCSGIYAFLIFQSW